MADDDRLTALGELVLARRETLRIGRRKAADAGGMSPTTWEKIEKGGSVYSMTYGGVETALGWPTGSVRHFLDTGEEPTPEQAGTEEVDEGPPLRRATLSQILNEIARRDAELRDTLAARLYPHLVPADATETADSVRERGAVPGRPMSSASSDESIGGER